MNASVQHIHESLNNKHRIGYYRRKELTKLGYSFDGGESLEALIAIQNRFGNVVQSSSLDITCCLFSVQTTFMKARLIDDSKTTGRDIPGVLTDATFTFFSSGYLLTSSVYCNTLNRWVPVLFTWMRRNDNVHHLPHFRILVRQILEAYEDRETQDRMVSQVLHAKKVVDFSMAQRNAFLEAYIEVRGGVTADIEEKDAIHAHAKTLIRGCKEHFRASITRLKRNHAIIPIHEIENFEHQCMSLLTIVDRKEWDILASSLPLMYPNASNWFQWWFKPDIAAMLFPCMYDQSESLEPALPLSTNAQEAMHSLLYQLWDDINSLSLGFNLLLLFALSLESIMHHASQGGSIRYGEAEHWKKTAAIYGTTKSNKKKSKKDNDGRPPDTTMKLLKVKVTTKSKKKGNDKTTNRVVVSEQSQINQSARRSYQWRDNSCYVDALLESLYMCYVMCATNGNPMWDEVQFKHFDIIQHFKARFTGDSLRADVTKGQNDALHFITQIKKSYRVGQMGNPFHMLTCILEDAISDSRENLEIIVNTERGRTRQKTKLYFRAFITLTLPLIHHVSWDNVSCEYGDINHLLNYYLQNPNSDVGLQLNR